MCYMGPGEHLRDIDAGCCLLPIWKRFDAKGLASSCGVEVTAARIRRRGLQYLWFYTIAGRHYAVRYARKELRHRYGERLVNG